MQNTPQLSAEIEKRFDEAVRKQNNYGNPYWPDWDSVKSFLATALEEQKQETLSEVEGWLDENVQPLDLVEDDLRAKLAEMKK